MMLENNPPTYLRGVEMTAEDMEDLRKKLAQEESKVITNLAGWQRAQADYINYKRSSEQQRKEIVKFANSALVRSLLPVLDDLELYFTDVPQTINAASWLDGIRLIERKLKATLQAQGLTEIQALGEMFDPNIHEVITSTPGEEGVVVQEFQKGYRFHDQIIRPSKVSVGNSKEIIV